MIWACEKFSDYLLGCDFLIVPLSTLKQLDSLPPQTLWFRFRLARYKYNVEHVQGRDLYTADALSRAPVAKLETEDQPFQTEVETFINNVVDNSLPATK